MSEDYSQILWQAYDQFLLPLGGKKIPTPYRRNEYGSYQKLGPEFQGKSSPQILTKITERLAKEQSFNLKKASVEEIRNFMQDNKLGIDCSGFAYRLLNFLVKKVRGKPLTSFGLPNVGRTYLSTLTSDEFSLPISNFTQSQSGDVIRLNSGEDILHGVIILNNQDGIITYAHSSSVTNPTGVHTGKIKQEKFPEDLEVFKFNPAKGDGVRRLKVLA